MHVQHKTDHAQRLRPDPADRLDVEGFKHRIDANPVAIPNDVGEIHGSAIDQNQIHFGMRHAQRLDQILDRSPPLELVAEINLAPLQRQKIVQFLVKPDRTLAHGSGPVPADSASQFSTRNPGTRENSRTLSVTSVNPRARA